MTTEPVLKMGWAETDITPSKPVAIAGNFGLRVSEGVADPLNVTVWAVESGGDQAIFVSCDLVVISDELRGRVRSKLTDEATGIDPTKLILHATHTHTAPEIRIYPELYSESGAQYIGVNRDQLNVDLMTVGEYLDFAAERIASAVNQAWNVRAPGGIGFGMGFVVAGRNRIWVDAEGKSAMQGSLNDATKDGFRHIEGYEDHELNVITVYDANSRLTGLVVNFACTAQVPGDKSPHLISADVWCEAREELKKRFGGDLHILPQVSAAGEQTGHTPYNKIAEKRMLQLMGKTKRQDVANRLADEIERLLPIIGKEIHQSVDLRHHVETVPITAYRITEDDVRFAQEQAEQFQNKHRQEKEKLEQNPQLQQTPRWHEAMSTAYHRMHFQLRVVNRFASQSDNPTLLAEVHVLRMGEMLIATFPFEYYLDYGVQIKVRSPATQTFLVELAGGGTYVPSPRALLGSGYGATPASNRVGAEGGQQLAEYIVQTMRKVWQ
ncbi:MAG: hypothetical protein K0Q59_5422 [Paenibacillus sp.]|nr:hypothetical protein [Paenibacillus sp.]